MTAEATSADEIGDGKSTVRRLPSWDSLPSIEIRTPSGIVRQLFVGAIIATLWLGSIVLARWDAAGDRDRYWRHAISTKSATVTQIMERAGVTLPAADQRRVDALEAEKAALATELNQLNRELSLTPLSGDCRRCRIPARRLRFEQRRR